MRKQADDSAKKQDKERKQWLVEKHKLDMALVERVNMKSPEAEKVQKLRKLVIGRGIAHSPLLNIVYHVCVSERERPRSSRLERAYQKFGNAGGRLRQKRERPKD